MKRAFRTSLFLLAALLLLTACAAVFASAVDAAVYYYIDSERGAADPASFTDAFRIAAASLGAATALFETDSARVVYLADGGSGSGVKGLYRIDILSGIVINQDFVSRRNR